MQPVHFKGVRLLLQKGLSGAIEGRAYEIMRQKGDNHYGSACVT